jgi:hypothetical protein
MKMSRPDAVPSLQPVGPGDPKNQLLALAFRKLDLYWFLQRAPTGSGDPLPFVSGGGVIRILLTTIRLHLPAIDCI